MRDAIWSALNGWHRFLVAVDGVDGAGKSTLGRYLAWQLGISLIETDTFLVPNTGKIEFRNAELQAVLRSRLDDDRPIIVEGVTVLRTLHTLSLDYDFLVWVEQEDWSGSHGLASTLAQYRSKYQPAEKAHFTFKRDAG